MALAAGSCFLTLSIIFGALAIANRKQIAAWCRDVLVAAEVGQL